MLFRNLTPKTGVTLNVSLADVHLPVRLGHRDAEKAFIVPLNQQLAAAGLGTVAGFEARQPNDGEIAGMDIYLGLTDASRPALETVSRMLNHLGAPYGSSIRLSEASGDPVLFGSTEGLELSIGLDVTANAEARKTLAQTCRAAIEDHAISRGWVRRADRTLFYFYGESFHEMKERLSRILADDPRFAGASFRRLA
ncbi:MAG: hypothetical protein KJO67_07040 [Silicimonas sp.]|nr:hypothetical protein [Silicimonas sp.]